ncbi:MAG TPA: YbhB/YbcL family Raf kinase inhibitor-like protein [Acidimicrobiia bacterium]
MDLTSPDFEDGERIPDPHTRHHRNEPPELHWSGVPSDVVELVLICEDPDAPSGTFVHWVAWGIDPRSGHLPDGEGVVHGRNDFGDTGYGGPAPPPGHGPHRYEFVLHGVREPVRLEPGAGADELRAAIDDRVVATATLTGIYER